MVVYVMTKRKCNTELPNNLTDLNYGSFFDIQARKQKHTHTDCVLNVPKMTQGLMFLR